MKKRINILVLTGLLFGLVGCGDTTSPTAEVASYTMPRNIILSEDKLIEKMVTNIEDNKPLTISSPVDITNYSDIDFTKVATTKLYFTVTDDNGNQSEYNAELILTPTEQEQSEQVYTETLTDYLAQLDTIAAYQLADEKKIEKMKLSVDHLTTSDYIQYQEKIDQYKSELLIEYTTANDVKLITNNGLVEKILKSYENDSLTLKYKKQLDTIDISEPNLDIQDSNLKLQNKLEQDLNARYRKLEIKNSGIPAELYDNTFSKVTLCSYNVGRNPNVKVDIGAGDRSYYAYTNEYSQLAFITADQIIVQNESTDGVTDSGKYCDQPAEISGDGTPKLVIADSLGGASNAYNVISSINAYSQLEQIENEILAYGQATDFRVAISYQNTETNTPSTLEFSYKLGEDTVTHTVYN